MHEIDSGALDLRLPAPLAFSAAVKCVERNLSDEANHVWSVIPNDS